MSGAESKQLLTLQSYLTHPYVCSYLPDRMACSEVVVPAHLIDAHVYSQLVNMGFRRSGLFVYRPACDSCYACVPIRVLVDAFEPSKNQKKASRQLAHLEAGVFDLKATDEYYSLYHKYQKKRHSGGGMDKDEHQQYQEFLGVSGVNTKVVEYREVSANHALRMVSIMDVLSDGLSAVYTYYEPDDEKRSYGTYGILWQIAHAKKLGLPYVYLGYWVKDCQKMSYKSNFQPFEVLTEQGWQCFDDPKLL